MTRLSNQEIADRFHSLESDNVERTESAKKLDKIREAICAFSNDLPGKGQIGVCFVGQCDDGTCAGLTIDDDLLQSLANLGSDGRIQPFPLMMVDRMEIDGCALAVLQVVPHENPPLRAGGRVWVRIGPTCRQATIEEERRLVEKRRWGALPFDQQGVALASCDDLDLDRFRKEYLPAALPADIIAANSRSKVEQLQGLRFLTPDALPTNSAMLVLGRDPRQWLPGAYIQFCRFDGATMTAPVKDQKEIGGTVVDQLSFIDEVCQANIAVAADMSGPTEQRRPDYPLVALRELIRNAVMHRNYEGTAAPVHVYWYSDRIEIANPGGPFGIVTSENFGKVTDYRNPALAEALKNLGYVQKFGMGISLARKALSDNGNPEPTFDVEPTHVVVTVRRMV